MANVIVSVWPGILYAATFYKKEHADIKSIFWEFEVSIWLNAACRLVSLFVFAVAMCRIGDVIKNTSELSANGSMVCLNWTLVILSGSVQASLLVFYSLGLIYEENDIFQQYTVVMMYVNVACTCASQVILSFIFCIMSEPLEIFEHVSKDGYSSTVEVRRDNLTVFKWLVKHEPYDRADSSFTDKDNSLNRMLIESRASEGRLNATVDTENSYEQTPPGGITMRRLSKEAQLKPEVRSMLMMFFGFCEPAN